MDGDRSIRAFTRAIRESPGFGLRVVSTLALTAALLLSKGWKPTLVAIGIGLLLMIGLGYPRFRRRGSIS